MTVGNAMPFPHNYCFHTTSSRDVDPIAESREDKFVKLTRVTILIAVITLSLLAGCQATQPEPTPAPEEQLQMAVQRAELIGSSWEVESFGGEDDALAVIPGSALTLNMFVERYGGYDGCNWFIGVYAVDGDTLRFDTPAITSFICQDEAISAQGATYDSALVNITRYEMEGDKLVTYTVGDQKMATFIPAEKTAFEGTPWTVKFVNYGDGMTQASDYDFTVTARFEDGKMTGFGGCTEYEAGYVIDGESITVSDITAAGDECTEDSGSSELQQWYFDALSATTKYETLVASTVFANEDNTAQVLFGTP
jgi:heat shock protein HslJ